MSLVVVLLQLHGKIKDDKLLGKTFFILTDVMLAAKVCLQIIIVAAHKEEGGVTKQNACIILKMHVLY